MVLLMIASALAGCTSGDPDGDGGMGIDTDMLNEMIEDNLQDFINNTSVTVHQEIHYHNNTTVVNNYDETNNEYQNTTNVDGEEVVNNNYNTNHYNSSLGGGDGSGSMLHGIDFVFTLQDILGVNESTADRDNTYTTNYSYYDYFTSEFRNDMFTFNCGVYYIDVSANSSNSSNYWDDSNNFDDAWDDNGKLHLRMTCHVNGKLISDGNTNDLYHSFGDMIERASMNTKLMPGEYIGSGTVGTGCILELRPENTGGWIQKGDTVTLEVERLGKLENKIV